MTENPYPKKPRTLGWLQWNEGYNQGIVDVLHIFAEKDDDDEFFEEAEALRKKVD